MKFVLGSNNPGKLHEFQKLLSSSSDEFSHKNTHEVISQSALNIPDTIEDGDSFRANALIKAQHASKHSGLPAISDDSGLCVDYLNGDPGIYSARFAGEHATSKENIEKLLDQLQGVPMEQRDAHFHCTIAMIQSPDDPNPIICEGEWHGKISESQTGTSGFGYDPVFFIPKMNCTSAELPTEIKNKYSHRAIAMQKLIAKLL